MKLQSDIKQTKQVRIDYYWHLFLKVLAAQSGRTVRELIEECLGDYYSLEEFLKVEEKKVK